MVRAKPNGEERAAVCSCYDRGTPPLRFIDKATLRVGCLLTMSLDLNTILQDWPHENGNIRVREIAGLDGREKLQLRVDLGVLQMELTGRPDGRRPPNCESLLEYHQRRAT